MNKKMVRDIVILAVIAVVAIVAYQFYSVGNRVKKETATPTTAPPPSVREGTPPNDAVHGGAGMDAFQERDKVFGEKMNKVLQEANVEKFDPPKSGVVATVNGEKIQADEFERRLESRKTMMGGGAAHGGGKTDDASAKNALLEKMIEEALIRQEAEKLGISVTEEEIQAELKARMKGFPSEDEFNKALKTHNFTVQDIREQLARELLIEKLKTEMTKDVPIMQQQRPAEQQSPHGAEAQ